MKQTIPINTVGGGVSRTIYSHYAQAGWHDFDPTSPIPHTSILEIEMEEPNPIQVAQIYDPEQNPINGRVYSEDGIAPTLRTPTGSLSEPKIMQIGSYVPNSMCAGEIVDAEGIAPTVMENHGTPTAVVGPSILGYTRDDKGGIQNYHERELAGTIHTSSGSGGNTDQFVKTRYRIRKLTPTECLRLMDCEDEDIQKILNAQVPQVLKSGKVKYKPLPKTAAYKLAGNSICVAPLYYIFKAMFVDEPPRPKPIQKSLFDI